ncbi:MAG TPA: matrixin family metalloprotease [Bdellovibrionales bacterium]|nr:matrixin family metalloprotease [Bdellovibrionales bacterium]
MRALILIAVLLASSKAPAFTLQEQGLIGWSVKHLSVNVNYASCPIDQSQLERAIDHAFELWNAVATANIYLVRGANSATTPAAAIAGTATDSPVIVCDTALTATIGRDSENIAGWTELNQSSGTIVYAAILLNAEAGKSSRIQNLGTTQLELAIAHEVGHLLGLGHSADDTSLMHHDYRIKNQLRLSQDDIDGLTYLYTRVEPDEDKVFGCSTVGSASGGAAPGAPGPFLWMLVLCAAAALWARRPSHSEAR